MKKLQIAKAALAALTIGATVAFKPNTPNFTNYTVSTTPTAPCTQMSMPSWCNVSGLNICTMYTIGHTDNWTFYEPNIWGTCLVSFCKF